MPDPGAVRDPSHLVGLASRGDGDAAAALLEQYLPSLVTWIRQHAGTTITARESASDLAQSACREVLGRLAAEQFVYRDEQHFRAWLFQAALRKIQDRGRYWARERRDARRDIAAGTLSASALEAVFAALGTPCDVAVSQEEREQVARAIEQLDDRQREVLRLAKEEGLSHREIGARLGIEESHSRTLLARTLARLARLVTGSQD